MPLKEARYEVVTVPESFGPVELVVDRRKVLDYAFAQDEYRDWYLRDSPFGGPIAHPLVLANDLLFLFYEAYDGNTAQGLHTHEHLTFHSPLEHGEQVVIEGGYTEKFERRGQGYVTLEADARAADGRLLVQHVGKEIMRTVAGEVVGSGRSDKTSRSRTVLGTVDESAETVERARANLSTRAPISARSATFTQDQMSVFSWASKGYSNVHTSNEKAAASGLERTIVQAQQQTGLVLANLVDLFGASWFTSGDIDLRFISPAYVNERLTTSGAIVGESDGRLEVEVWIDKEDGTRTAVGWASASVDDDTRRPVDLF